MEFDLRNSSNRGFHPRLPLRGFRIADTGRAEEAEHILSRELSSLRIMSAADRSRFRLRMNGARLGGVLVGYNRFDVQTKVSPGRLDDAYILSFGHERPSVLGVGSSSVVTTPTSAAVISPGCDLTIDRSAGSGMFLVRTTPSVLEKHLQGLTATKLRGSLRFSPGIDLSTEPGATALRLVRFVISELENCGPVLGDLSRQSALQDLMLAALLTLPNNHSDLLEFGYRGLISPRVVRVAEEFLEAQIGEAVSVSDLLEVCGCSRSVLFEAFARYRNHTPMQFLTDRRMDMAHRLLRSRDGKNVTAVALRCGFAHLGRFAGAYRVRFGETPSETIRQREL